LFEKEDFEKLQKCLIDIGETHFVIIENTFGNHKKPFLRMKFPVNISWNELMNGNFISSILFEMFQNEYFVFSANDTWGKYAANDYEWPLDLIGFKEEYKTLFGKIFKVSNEEEQEIFSWLPSVYKQIVTLK